MTTSGDLKASELIAHLPDLDVTDRQREFIKAALRALLKCALLARKNEGV